MLTILHTNDFHNRLQLNQSDHLKELRRAVGANGLLLDAGDAIGAGNVTFRPGGEPILQEMTSIGYDAMTVGNREFHFSRLGFRTKLCRSGFPALCANLRSTHRPDRSSDSAIGTELEATSVSDPRMDATELPVKPYLFRDGVHGARVVVFGITVPMITERMAARKFSAYVFDDPIQSAIKLVPLLRSTLCPDLLIALTHIGIRKDRELAAAVPEIDLIIGGHTHVVLEQGERVGETLIVQAGSHGRFVGQVEIEWERGTAERPRMNARLEPL